MVTALSMSAISTNGEIGGGKVHLIKTINPYINIFFLLFRWHLFRDVS